MCIISLKGMYGKSNCSIKLTVDLSTKPFLYDRGVRQGCVLSPLLFNLYINELPELLENDYVDPFALPKGDKLSCLMYVDDLIILSQSATGLQNSLEIISKFCSKWGLSVNLAKTKAME